MLSEAEMLGKAHVNHGTEAAQLSFSLQLWLVTAACTGHAEQGGTIRVLSDGHRQGWVGKSCPLG